MTRVHLHKLARKGGEPPAERRTAAPAGTGSGGIQSSARSVVHAARLPVNRRRWRVDPSHLVVEVFR
jgi:hypothetical protein